MPAEDASFASPPCFAHELDAATGAPVDAQQARDVARWRRAAREQLIAARQAIPVADRARLDAAIVARLDAALGDLTGRVVSACWPFRGEPDLRGWMETARARGARCALPVVVEKAAPMIFRLWTPGAPLTRGVWNIPVPAEGAAVAPDVVIAPVVGFDPDCYRLGYGGGYFDRTLAAMARRPVVAGVGHAFAALPTIYPQPHDIPLDFIATPEALIAPRRAGKEGTP